MRKAIRRFIKRGLWIALAIFIGLQAWYAAHIWWWRTHNPAYTAVMQERLIQLRQRNPHARLEQHWVAYRQISPSLKRAVIAAEDAKFMTHWGFDWAGIRHALETDIRHGELRAGGSTISQQLAKNLLLSERRSFLRKGEEALITLMLEGMMSKQRILELYLNTAEWGQGIFGIGAASEHYFHCTAQTLGPEQSALLASMLPSPRYYDRLGVTTWLAEKAGIVRQRMPEARIP
ncbi:monofunctional biosynthetic peptidoglycan transglycosylase [Mangrovitalea sediminis]|uniref:monofunctional biosynthetic peptidoglycan transglycosylase n=1 Tax=Mangrovitalea sediminis TaxID=1982043 RepID=UPI000BE5FC2E|nr:monofunctional biosynthetic peptidoglycan transglycosylase [Mangrovitalea sediminis]